MQSQHNVTTLLTSMSNQSLIPVYTHLSYIILVLLVLPQMLALVKQGRYLFNPYNVKDILVWLKLYHLEDDE